MDELLAAVARRDADAVAACFTVDAVYHVAVPYEPLTGRDAIRAAFAAILAETDAAQWDVVSSAVAGDLVFLERVDHFQFAGGDAPIECLGVIRMSGDLIAEVRDYCDIGLWNYRRAEARGVSPRIVPAQT
ncbi:nuclear transport factor 2 family protein [Pseudonocardia halophobica]|uniref:nuclear transport factor 2 family protein n=1 Tax=Pseudonocardia halophobica TaxID=29401 RepID=UPI0018CBFFFC|nr:nuclear transport factor 2 family protein [Pseudonocardia halophobica]